MLKKRVIHLLPIRLTLLPTASLIQHETIVDDHVEDLVKQMDQNGTLHHPLPVYETDGQYIVLDGHHRLATLKRIGVPFVPVQVVPRENIRLSHWYHVVSPRWQPSLPAGRKGKILGVCQTVQGPFEIQTEEEFAGGWIQTLWDLYRTYESEGFLRKQEALPSENWVLYKGIRFEDVLHVVKNGYLFPPGITRFHIAYRILNLNVPLALLYTEDAEAWKSLCQRASSGRIYQEPVVCVE